MNDLFSLQFRSHHIDIIYLIVNKLYRYVSLIKECVAQNVILHIQRR